MLQRGYLSHPSALRFPLRAHAHPVRSPRARPLSTAQLSSLPLDIAPSVLHALAHRAPIVALESTLITHGLPPPYSYDLPLACEDILRKQGVVPATIAILNGRIKVGLSEGELKYLSEKGYESRRSEGKGEGEGEGGGRLWKVGRRELAAAVVKGVDGGTTVSATMAVANMVGIKVFATGGIGGVHRGAETSFDISSDLIALSDTPVAVVCAGSKSILDIGLTLEYLEAHAVPVASYGTNEWPAFYSPRSGFKAPMRIDSALEVAKTIHMTDLLGLSSSLLLGVPIPEEFHAVGESIQSAVDQAVRESVENGMSKSGKRVTPWLLERVGQLTKGRAILSNMALIKNNVKVGGEISSEHAKLVRSTLPPQPTTFMPSLSSLPPLASSPAPTPPVSTPVPPLLPPSPLLIIGSLALDVTLSPTSSVHHTTSPGGISLTLGGVAHNIASSARSLGIDDVLLVAPVGDDLFGGVARKGMEEEGLRGDGLLRMREGQKTPACGILLDRNGELVGGVADMRGVEEVRTEEVVEIIEKNQAKFVCLDGNLSPSTLAGVMSYCMNKEIPTLFEPTSNQKSLRILSALESLSLPTPLAHAPLSICTPNINELSSLYNHASTSELALYATGPWFDSINVNGDLLQTRLPPWVVKEGIPQMAVPLLGLFNTLLVTCGGRGLVVVQRLSGVDQVAAWRDSGESKKKGTVLSVSGFSPGEAVLIRYYKALEIEEKDVGTVTGAGDTLVGGVLAALARGLEVTTPKGLDSVVNIAQRSAILTLKSSKAVGDLTELRSLIPS